VLYERAQRQAVKAFQGNDPRLGQKYEIGIETISKPKEKYLTDEYFELDLPVAPAVMVGDEILVEGTDVSEEELETVICRHLGLPQPEPQKKRLLGRLFN
jgi:hypothetical protein